MTPAVATDFGGRLAKSVVLDGEDDRQLPDLREVHAFGDRALIDRAVAAERDGDVVAAENLRRHRRAAGDRGAAADDAVRPQHAQERSAMCMEPPLPRQSPVSLP